MSKKLFVMLAYFGYLNLNTLAFKFEKDRLFYQGNFGFQFGNITNINVSPSVGYIVNNKLRAGVGIITNYVSFNGVASNFMYGTRVFSQYMFLENLFLTAEYQLLNNNFNNSKKRTWEAFPLLGAGYRYAIGNHLFVDVSLLWNFNTRVNNIYTNPIIRGGVSFR
jgi:hypothetical protein